MYFGTVDEHSKVEMSSFLQCPLAADFIIITISYICNALSDALSAYRIYIIS